MKEQLKRDLNKTYLVLESEASLYEETYELQMMIHNSLQTLLPLHVMRVNAELHLYYDISAKQTLRLWAEREGFSFETLCCLFETVEKMFSEVKNYLLDVESVLFDLEHIYIQEGNFYFCYCPWEKKDTMTALRELLEEILGQLDYHDTKGVELAYHFYQSACKGSLRIEEILKEHCVKEEKREETCFWREEPDLYEMTQKEEVKETKEQAETEKKSYRGIWGRICQFLLKKTGEEEETEKIPEEKIPEIEVYEEEFPVKIETSVSALDGNTVLLDQVVHRNWRLQPLVPDYEVFYIREDCFVLGKKKEAVDGCIPRSTISRIHSRLYVREGRLFVSDANSTNGTFVNGIVLHPGEEVEIFSGDRILFADVGYECYNSL